MKPEQETKIRKHGENLQAIFPATRRQDPILLCKSLRRLEVRTSRAAEDACNTQEGADAWEHKSAQSLATLKNLLDADDIPVFINGDPRGYALKIECDFVTARRNEAASANKYDSPWFLLHRDWGGYGIIAPEIT